MFVFKQLFTFFKVCCAIANNDVSIKLLRKILIFLK
jgi:hypothetical protein